MVMADCNLYLELKKRYPEVPDAVLTSYVSQFGNDREQCIRMLTNESPKYLFDNQNCQVNDRFSDLNIGEPRPRSDSSGSNMSNASSTSASSRPAYNSSHSYMNVPGYRGPIIGGTDDLHPPTAPVLPNEINNFMELCRYEQTTTSEIPNINCKNSHSVEGFGSIQQQGGSYGLTASGISNSFSSQPNLRQIHVQHIQTSRGDTNKQQNFSEIKIQANHGSGVGHSHNSQSQPATPSRNWVQHPVRFNSPYHNMMYPGEQNSVFPPDPRSLNHSQQPFTMNQQSTTPTYRSPVEEQRSLMGYNQHQQFGSQQHLSQATIYLQNPTASPNSQMNSGIRVEHPQPMLSPADSYSSNIGEINYSPNVIRNNINSQPSPQGINSSPSVLVEIKTPLRGGGTSSGVQSQIQYFNKIATGTNSPHGSASPHTVQTNVLGGHVSPSGDQTVNESQPPPFINRLYTPERPTVINFTGVGTPNRDEGFLKFPPMPDECRVPGHQHGPIKTCGSVDSSSSVFGGSDMEYRHMHQPFMSPASSPNSISSESSAAVRERPRSGSLQEDPAYLQALLSHQKSRMDKLMEDLGLAEKRLDGLKSEVINLERRVIDKKRQKSSVFPSVDLAKLRGDNLQLQADIQLMTREIDLFNNGQTPLGVLDPLEQQNFYKNMSTGQRGSIYASYGKDTPRMFETTVTTTVSSAVSTPTRPPPEIPPQLPPRDPAPRDVPPPVPPRSAISAATHVPPAPSNQPVVNSGDSDADGEQWSCSACTFLNHPALNKCECCEMPRMNVTTSSSINSPRDVPDSYPTTVATIPSTSHS